jgi:general secretion pathway protein G
MCNLSRRKRGFTLIELLVVLSIIALLITVAAPRYFASVQAAKETALRENLKVTRDALQRYYSDRGRYPETLEALQSAKYLVRMPVDPITERSDSWEVVAPVPGIEGKVADIRSGARGTGQDGTGFATW